VAANYHTEYYHISTVVVKIELKENWSDWRGRGEGREGKLETRKQKLEGGKFNDYRPGREVELTHRPAGVPE
jgi:hypothetical protein